jgi:Trk K+ transport system NAD-binding subunit
MDILIYGCQRLTTLLLPPLLEQGHLISVLGDDPDRMAQLPDDPRVNGILTAEPLLHDYLQRGGVANAHILLALSSDDHRNLLVAQIAQHIFNVPAVVCYLESPYLQDLYAELGLKVVGPHTDLLQQIQQDILD